MKCLLLVFGAHRRIRVAAAMTVAMLRKSSYARAAWTAALQHPETHLLAGDHALNGALVRSSSSSSIAVPGRSTPLGRTISTLLSNISLQRKVHCSGVFFSRSFSVGVERNGSSEGSISVRLDDFRSLINRKKSETAILEVALEILETAPRDKRFADLVRKHNLQFESEKSVLQDPVVEPNIEFEPTSQIVLKNDADENNSAGLEPAKTTYSQPDRSWNAAKPPPPKTDSPLMFGKLSLDDFPPPDDPSLERLLKKRRRQELMKEYERNSKRESLNFGAAAKSAVGGSNPTSEPPVDPLRPNANVFLKQPGEKTYRSLADRLYEEQFGHPAPPGLKRTYPKGSFYDRATKEKERKDREAAAASARMAARSTVPSRGPIESQEETTDNSLRKTVSSNDGNQEQKPGSWKCPQCTFFNLAADKHCYKCQTQRGENGLDDERDSGRRSATGT